MSRGPHPALPALDYCGCRADCERGAAVGSAPGTGLVAQRLGVRRGCWPRAIATTRGGSKGLQQSVKQGNFSQTFLGQHCLGYRDPMFRE